MSAEEADSFLRYLETVNAHVRILQDVRKALTAQGWEKETAERGAVEVYKTLSEISLQSMKG